jgi:alkylation response protein AidB-like acyl-CoA dehydrogenase
LTDEQRALRDSVRDALKIECTPAKVRAAWEDGDRRAFWRTLTKLGVVGATVPEARGGLGLGALDMVPVFEECGFACIPGPVVETLAVGVPLLAALDDQIPWLARVASGEALLATGLQRAPFVADADIADLLLLERGGALHAVPRTDVALTAQPSIDGARRLFSVAWEPSGASCIASGELARAAIAQAQARGALATAAMLLGIGRWLVSTTIDYVKVRKQFGAAIGSFQAVKHPLADAHTALELARPLVWRAAHALDQREPERMLAVSMAKARASDAATRAARTALQCHGAIGYSFEHDLHLWMKRAWALTSSFGDASHHRAQVAHSILSRSTPPPSQLGRKGDHA